MCVVLHEIQLLLFDSFFVCFCLNFTESKQRRNYESLQLLFSTFDFSNIDFLWCVPFLSNVYAVYMGSDERILRLVPCNVHCTVFVYIFNSNGVWKMDICLYLCLCFSRKKTGRQRMGLVFMRPRQSQHGIACSQRATFNVTTFIVGINHLKWIRAFEVSVDRSAVGIAQIKQQSVICLHHV